MVVTIDNITRKIAEGKLCVPFLHNVDDIKPIQTNMGIVYGRVINKNTDYPVVAAFRKNEEIGNYELIVMELWNGFVNANMIIGVVNKLCKYKVLQAIDDKRVEEYYGTK